MNIRATKRESKFTRYFKAPFRVLSRAKEFYIRRVTDCSKKLTYGEETGPVAVHVLDKSFSVKSTRSNHDADLRDLIRVASQRGLVEQLEMEIRQMQQQQPSVNTLPRSATVAIGRIDEDNNEENYPMIPRSKSHTGRKRVSLPQSQWK